MAAQYSIYYDLGKKRKKYGITIKAIAETVGINERKIASYEHRKSFPVEVYQLCVEKCPNLFPVPSNTYMTITGPKKKRGEEE